VAHRLTLVLSLLAACSTSSSDSADAGPEAEVQCSFDELTIRCDRTFDPRRDLSDSVERTALHLVLAEPLDGPLSADGTMDLVFLDPFLLRAVDPADPRVEGFEPPGVFTEAQFLRSTWDGSGSGSSTRVGVSGELAPTSEGCVEVDLAFEGSFTHGWAETACPR